MMFVGTAALFSLGTLVCLWHLRWMSRLPALSEFATGLPPSGRSNIRCSIVVAARNEESRIEHTVRRLLAQTQVKVELIVVDDRSADRTGEILDQLAKEDSGLKVIHVTALPHGWLGKCHACHIGSKAATGEWILFTDADCWLKPDVIIRAVRLADSAGVDHVTLTSGISAPSPGLRACHLMFLLSIAKWFSGVNRDRPKSHLGIGAFNLVRAAAYHDCGGYEALRLTVLDDVKLGLLLRRAGKRTRAFLGADDVEAYWGKNVGSLIKIMEKNYFAALEFNTLLAVCIIAFLTLLISIVVLGVASRTLPGISTALSLLLLSIPAGILARRIGWSPGFALGAPFIVPIFIYALLNSTAHTFREGGIRWRETFYPIAALREGRVR
jgi:glycosyltransferase involved in cell wall biosynthesis